MYLNHQRKGSRLEEDHRVKYKTIVPYIKNNDVLTAIQNYHPVKGVKAIPFIMAKMKLSWLLYICVKCIPNGIINRLTM